MMLALSVCALLAAASLEGPEVQTPTTAFDQAMESYAKQDFRSAFDALARMADAGHPHAARIALLMVTHGSRLFGQRFEVSPRQRDRWLDVSATTAP